MTIQNITTTAGETFTADDSTALARLVLKRWGNDYTAAAVAWRRLMQNSCTDAQFAELTQGNPPSPIVERPDLTKQLPVRLQEGGYRVQTIGDTYRIVSPVEDKVVGCSGVSLDHVLSNARFIRDDSMTCPTCGESKPASEFKYPNVICIECGSGARE